MISPCNYALNDENWGNFKFWHFCDNLEEFPKLLKKEDIISDKISKKEISFDAGDPDQFEYNKKISKEMSLEDLPEFIKKKESNASLRDLKQKEDNFVLHKASFRDEFNSDLEEENLEYMMAESTSNLEDDEDFMNQISKRNFASYQDALKKGYDICSCNLLSLLFKNS